MTTVNMIALLVIVGVTASFACMHGMEKPEPQPNCYEGSRCPEYMVEEKAMGYERRMYAPALWVTTRMVGMDSREASMEGFNRLFDYISGENEDNKKIAMTSPVVSQVMPNEDMTDVAMNITMSFYVSAEYLEAGGPPMPNNPEIKVKRTPAMELYAREFTGYASPDMFLKEAGALAKLLTEAEEPFVCGRFATAGYDSPMKPFNRRNEVWMARMAEGDESRDRRCGAAVPRE